MTTAMALNEKTIHHEILESLRTRGWNHNTCGALVGLFGGVLAPLAGSVLTALAWIVGPTWHGIALRGIGTAFLILTIPLLLLGAHCLDLSDNQGADKTKGELKKHHDLGTDQKSD